MTMPKPLKIVLFVALVLAVGWLDLYFFDREEPLQFLWFILSGAAIIVVGYWIRNRTP